MQSAVNFSTSDEKLVEKIVENINNCAKVVDWSCDIDHNRSVVTIIGTSDEIYNALKICGKSADLIDLSKHVGAHPRVGSVDVVPITPLRGEKMEDCVELAHKVGHSFWEEFGIPVYFYEEACLREENRFLENCRSKDHGLLDLGDKPHATKGVSCIGARCPLIAYNVNLKTDNVKIAKIIAKEIRDMRKSGNPKMYGVKAMGLYLERQKLVQVTTNITRPNFVGPFDVYKYIEKRANELGAEVLESELIGGVAGEICADIIKKSMKFKEFNINRIL